MRARLGNGSGSLLTSLTEANHNLYGKMSACCVSGCKNRHSSASKLKFYRIPTGHRPFQANRRRLWLEAIRRATGSTEELKGNARICGAHFVSGEASMEHDNPDFVPSVFPSKQRPSSKSKMKQVHGRRKSLRHKANVKEKEETSPMAGTFMDVQSPFLTEETQTQSFSALPKTFPEEAAIESESDATESQPTSSPKKALTSFKVPAGIQKMGNMIPTVLLKSVFKPASGFQCELCSESFITTAQLVKHKQLHEENSKKLLTGQTDSVEPEHIQEPSFSCNMCGRSFATSHILKRHKLLHVKDGRKCPLCGVLFCQLHNHVLFLPQSQSEQEPAVAESPEPPEEPGANDEAESIVTETQKHTFTEQVTSPPSPIPEPLPEIINPLPPPSHTRIFTKVPVPKLKKLSLHPQLSENARMDYPVKFVQPPPPQDLQLTSYLKVFSPQHLTSAFIQVERNYDYILEKARKAGDNLVVVKEEPYEQTIVSPPAQPTVTPCAQRPVVDIKKEIIAYDMEIVL